MSFDAVSHADYEYEGITSSSLPVLEIWHLRLRFPILKAQSAGFQDP